MQLDRRNFLRVGSTLTAGALILPYSACNNNSSKPENESEQTETTETATKGSIEKFGIQLYTIRDVIYDNPKEKLKKLADFGYRQIESYEGKDGMGMFWGMSPTDFKKYCDDIGLDCVASHCDIYKDFEAKAAQAAEVGIKYLICPYIGGQESLDAYKKKADDFNNCGEICRKNGIRFAYHNHEYTFPELEGQIPQDFLMENTDPNLVDFEMDIYWVVTAGADPIAYFKKYPNRFKLSHVKDRIKNVPSEEREASCDLGTGQINFPEILKAAKEQGMEYFIVEQERYDNSTPLQSAEADANYLKKMQFA